MRKERVGFAVCGSFCTHQKVLRALETLTERYETVIPIVSEISAFTDTRFGTSEKLLERLEDLTGHDVLFDIPSVEPIGPKGLLDVLVIAPATGNTIAKLAAGITDSVVTMAAKAHLRNERPERRGAEYRGAFGAKKLLFRAFWAGQCPAKAHIACGRFRPAAGHGGRRASGRTASADFTAVNTWEPGGSPALF